MNESTSLVTGKDTLKQEQERRSASSFSWHQMSTTVGLFVVFTAGLHAVSNHPSTKRLPTSKAASLIPQEPKFELNLEQNLELWDHWKEYLSLQDIISESEDVFENTNLEDLFHPDNMEKHAQIWADQTLEEGQEWWSQTQEYFNSLSDSVVQNDLLFIHSRRASHHKKHWKMHPKKEEFASNIYMNHSDAFLLLFSPGNDGPYEYAQDYFQLNQGLDAQVNQAYCAVASSMAALNSLRGHLSLMIDPVYAPYPYATQADAFNECVNANVVVHNETFDGVLSAPGGINLEGAKNLLQCHLPEDGWKVEAFHVDPGMTPSQMRGRMKDALKDPTSRVIINYHRAIAGQVGGGHFSPIGAYNTALDAFLVMDVAKYKYAPVWIPTEKLYSSLFATDSCGHWKGPAAQASLPPQLLHPTSVKDMAAAMAMLGCQAAPRGFIIVSKK